MKYDLGLDLAQFDCCDCKGMNNVWGQAALLLIKISVILLNLLQVIITNVLLLCSIFFTTHISKIIFHM